MNRLVYFEQLGDINEAIAREKEIKLLTRKRKIKLIESINPHWKDLSQEWDEQAPESRIPRAPDTRARMTKGGKGAETRVKLIHGAPGGPSPIARFRDKMISS